MDAAALAPERTAAPRHTVLSGLNNAVLAAFYSLFLVAHFTAEAEWDWPYTLPVIVQQTVLVLVFLTRRPSLTTSHQPLHWVIAIAGTLVPLLVRPTSALGVLDSFGRPLMILGVVLSAVALLSLGRSMAVVPANRGIQTTGAYRFVRHPLYAAYGLIFIAYLMRYPDVRNAVVITTTLVLLGVRILIEERFLGLEPQYQAYCARVRWRLVPGVF